MLLPDEKHRLTVPQVGINTWISVDGKPLEVYSVTNSSTRGSPERIVGYIEAQDDKRWTAHFHDPRLPNPNRNDADLMLYVDGSHANSMLLQAAESWFSAEQDSPTRFQRTIRPFLFGHTRTTDNEDEACTDDKVVKSMGSIEFRYWRVKNVRLTDVFWMGLRDDKPVHEENKKAKLSHMADYDAPVERPWTNRFYFDWIDPEDSPLSIAEFRFRSRKFLELEGHIPPPPVIMLSPTPSPKLEASPPPRDPLPSPSLSGPSRRKRTTSSSRSPSLSMDDEALEAELKELKQERRIAQLEREKKRRSEVGIKRERSESSSSQKSGAGGDSAPPRLSPETRAAPTRTTRGEAENVERGKEKNRRKGKKPDVIDLCDSDDD